MELILKDKVLSPKVEERVRAALAAIEQANDQINWSIYKAYVTVRKFYRWRLPIFPQRRVFLDIVDKSTKTELLIPAEAFNSPVAWKKRGIGGRPIWCFRLHDVTARKSHGKIYIKVKGE